MCLGKACFLFWYLEGIAMIKSSFLGNDLGIAETTVWFQAQNILVIPSMREQTGKRGQDRHLWQHCLVRASLG